MLGVVAADAQDLWCDGAGRGRLELNRHFFGLALGQVESAAAGVTVNGGSRVPIVTCRGPLPLFLTLIFLLAVELTFTLPKLRLPETLKVPKGGVGVAVGVAV